MKEARKRGGGGGWVVVGKCSSGAMVALAVAIGWHGMERGGRSNSSKREVYVYKL